MRQRQYLRTKVAILKNQLKRESRSKVGGRLEKIWLVRAGLSDTNTPARSLSQWCQDFPQEEAQVISSTKVAEARDCFAELIKQQSRAELGTFAGRNPGAPIFVTHIHDEALMRLRSHIPSFYQHIHRARYTKVQNNFVSVSIAEEKFEWFCELQALADKTAPTIALAILEVIRNILQTVCPSRDGANIRRVLHLLTGDAIPTNLADSRFVLGTLEVERARQFTGLQYRLLVWVCASHQANLVTQIAIVGRIMKNPQHGDTIAAACSRLFKYLLPSYTEEFSRAMLEYLQKEICVELVDPTENQVSRDLQQLYGKDVLPDEILTIFNFSLDSRKHLASTPTAREAIIREAFRLLSQRLLLVEERPVVTRFWLFTNCVWALLCCKLLALPVCIWSVLQGRIREENAKRLTRFRSFYDSEDAGGRLRRAGLCLQLTRIAVSLSSQTRKGQDTSPEIDSVPLMVRIGRGDVQRRTALKTLCRKEIYFSQ